MESVFLSLCGYNLFVSAENYAKYYIAVREVSNPVAAPSLASANKTFNRFKADPGMMRVNQSTELDMNYSEKFRNLSNSNSNSKNQ